MTKILASLVTGIALLGLAACGDNASSDGAPPPPGASSTPDTTAPAAPEPNPMAPDATPAPN